MRRDRSNSQEQKQKQQQQQQVQENGGEQKKVLHCSIHGEGLHDDSQCRQQQKKQLQEQKKKAAIERPPVGQQRRKDHVAYTGSASDRAQRVRTFIKSLKFTVPLKQLRDNATRTPCPKCKRGRLFYCYDCLLSCNEATCPPRAPVLPANVHIVLHPNEHRSKSTSLPAATIAPEQIKVHTFPSVPDLNPKETVLLYPSPTAVNISDLDAAELNSLKNVVFIDSTWQQSKAIEKDEKIQSYRHIKIPARETLFWRYQEYDPTYLATIEAIYFTLVEVIKARNDVERKQKNDKEKNDDDGDACSDASLYNGEVDDLLLYYIYQFILIQLNYINQEGKKRQRGAAAAVDGAAAAADEDKKEKKEEENQQGAAAAAATSEKKEDDGGDAWKPFAKSFTDRHFGDYILEGAGFEEFFQ